MESISGLTNWRLSVRRESDGVTILRALTCDQKAVLPDELFGLPVTALQDHALAAGAAPAEGEELRILGGAESADWDNRNIKELTLPRALRQIGDYAFMNLRSMETLRFFDDLNSTGSGSFMNCQWAWRAVTGISVLMAIQSLVMIVLRNNGIGEGISISLVLEAILALVLPGCVIPLCMMETMRCHAIMKPGVMVFGIIIAVLSAINVVLLHKGAAKGE